ncbi:glycosyl hydrolase family 95 catalytic domain-containing protein [Parabacteroides faecis]|uniref:glycosyl hydrolase family 95 catalytic domain-containing protein n=1 Tax=Parabacteroides faecis TaxID=1217282 RepID=UPI0035214108
MKKNLLLIGSVWLLTACNVSVDLPVVPSDSDLQFPDLAKTWDEGMPLGNATVGALVWQRDSALRFSLDRTDLWDLRPMDSISGPNNRFAWVREQVMKGDYLPVQKKYDWPYDQQPAPSKIPGAALEFSLEELGSPSDVRLYLNNALCEAIWENGTTLKTFVHATEPVGWFVFENLPSSITPTLISPKYSTGGSEAGNSVEGQDLRRLGYNQGVINEEANQITYHQEGWNGFSYDVNVRWKQKGKTLCGVWSVTSSLEQDKASDKTQEAMTRGVNQDYQSHLNFWKNYWAESSVTLPDPVLQKQYDNEMYKYGSATREDSYPISLQAVWTADNGKLPPWKGDYHHDLNTQLSYWPTYTGNHLKEGLGYLNTLWNQRDVYKEYTRQYFETDGMNVPGVCTLQGVPMGGWIQYSMSQTAGAWLAQHFYLHWKYSMDREFLKDRAYPFLKEVATFLEQISVVDAQGIRKLTMSSSPEIYDNSINAWFKDMTNYDLALMKFAFSAASELAGELNIPEEAAHWQELNKQLPELDTDKEGALTFAKGFSYDQSHRHFSHAMAIHPLGLLDWSQGEKSQKIIRATIKKLEDYGPDYWTGYSYSWCGNMKARAFDGEGAAQELRTFAECFCLRNTFHANGDQTKTGKSKFTYRPFTLEGNFAFASGIQEMLLQSHTGIIRIFPAIPAGWSDVSFDNLRAMGAFLISAEKQNGKITKLRIYPEQGGTIRIASPFGTDEVVVTGNAGEVTNENGILSFDTRKGEWIEINN